MHACYQLRKSSMARFTEEQRHFVNESNVRCMAYYSPQSHIDILEPRLSQWERERSVCHLDTQSLVPQFLILF